MPPRSLSLNSIICWSLFAIVVGSFCYIMFIYPYAMDDHEFLYGIHKRGIIRELGFEAITDNSRFGNSLGILFLLWPKWIAETVQAVMLVIGTLIMMKLAAVKTWRQAALFFFLFVFCPNWNDGMFCQAHAFNYTVAYPFFFGTVYLYFHPGKVPAYIAFIVSFIAGGWNEVFTPTLMCGWAIMWLFDRKSFNRENRIIVIAALLGFIWLLAFPGAWHRQSLVKAGIHNLKEITFAWSYILYVIVWLCIYINRSLRHLAVKPFILFNLGGFAFLPFLYSSGMERSTIPSTLLCAIAFTVLIKDIYKEKKHKSPVFSGIIACVLGFTTVIHVFAVDREASNVLPLYQKYIDGINAEPIENMYFFSEIRYPWQASYLTLQRPQKYIMDPAHINMLWPKITKQRWDVYVVPEDLKEYRKGLGTPLKGEDGLRVWKGHIISDNLVDTNTFNAFVRYIIPRNSNDTTWLSAPEYTRIYSRPFPGADGNQYVYVYPSRSFITNFFGNPAELKFYDEKQSH